METVVAEPDAPASSELGVPDGVDATPPQPAALSCAACGAAMAPEQDWCLACGTAAPGRVSQRAGLRTAATVAALTLVLVAGAVAASYAALTHGTDTTMVASAPAAPAAPAPTPTTPAPAPAPAHHHTHATTTTSSVPASPPPTPTVAPTPLSTPTVTPTPTPTPRATTTTPKTTTPTATAIVLAKGALAVYDPFLLALTKTDPAATTDGDPSTAFTVSTAPAGTAGVRVGLTIDLGTPQKVTQIKLQTPTPGFSVEIYGAVGPTIPPTLPDTAWHHLHNQSDIGSADGNAQIHLGKHGKGVSPYRYLLVWITNPPTATPGTRDAPVITDTTATTPVVTATDTTATATTGTVPPSTIPPAPGPTVSIAELSVFG